MRPLLLAGLAVLVSLPAGAVAPCADAYKPEYEAVWEFSPSDWDAACAKGEAPEKILSAAQKSFAARCADGARPSILAGLTNEQSVAGLCARGVPGREKIPRPQGGSSAGLHQGDVHLGAVGATVGNFVSGDIAGLYGERTMGEGSPPVEPAKSAAAGNPLAQRLGEKGLKVAEVPAVGDAPTRATAIAQLRKRVVVPEGVKDPAVVNARIDLLLGEMLAGVDPALVRRLNDKKVTIIVIPVGKKMTDIPPFTKLKGKKTFDGRSWDDVRGVADVSIPGGGVACAVPEENLTTKTVKDSRGYPKDYVFFHEVGHMIEDYGITGAQRNEVTQIYLQTVKRKKKTGLGAYGDSNADEFWAQATAVFFSRPNTGGPTKTPGQLKKVNKPIYDLLVKVYGPPAKAKK